MDYKMLCFGYKVSAHSLSCRPPLRIYLLWEDIALRQPRIWWAMASHPLPFLQTNDTHWTPNQK